MTSFMDDGRGLRPLRTFTALKSIKLPVTVFKEFAALHGKIRNIYHERPELLQELPKQVLPLVDVLPLSLETFVLSGELPEGEVQNLFAGLGKAKGTFQQLSEVNLERLKLSESLKVEIVKEMAWAGIRV